MKKIILPVAIALCSFGASAQYQYSSAARLDSIENALSEANAKMQKIEDENRLKDVWRSGRYFNVGYSSAQTVNEISPVAKGKFAFFIGKGTSYLWSKKGFFDILKVGLDVKWFDLDYAMYKKEQVNVSEVAEDMLNGWTQNPGATSDVSEKSPYVDVKRMSLLVGMFGFGPNITVAPLAKMNNKARSLKLSLYFHYQPTFGAFFYFPQKKAAGYGSNDVMAQLGYVSMWDFGGRVSWRNIGLGVEGRWGSGRFKNSQLTVYDEASKSTWLDAPSGVEKFTRKFAETRVYLYFNF